VPGDRPGEYILPVTKPATVGPDEFPFVMGGTGFAAAIDSLQQECDQRLLWATIQFLSPTQGVDELTIDCQQIGGGQTIGQWSAQTRAGERMVHNISAALGTRERDADHIFAQMPDVPMPDDCEEKPADLNGSPGNLIGQFERRIAMENAVNGVEAAWVRPRGGFPLHAPILALISDFFLGAHPRTRTGTSIDATFRFIQPADHGWVLSVTEMAAFDRGTVSGSARHFAQDGRLLAISSQTGVLPRIPLSAQ